jgi:hypothetical protein
MREADLLALGRVLAQRGEGFNEITQVSERRQKDNLAVVERLAEVSRRPVLYNVVQALTAHPDFHRRTTDWLADCHRRGLRIYGQGVTVRQPFHVMLSEWNLFDMAKTWNRALQGTRENKLRNLRDGAAPACAGGRRGRFRSRARRPDQDLIEGARNAPPRPVARTQSATSRRSGQHPSCLLDLSLAASSDDFLTRARAATTPMPWRLLASPHVIAGVSDGGAREFWSAGLPRTCSSGWSGTRDASAWSRRTRSSPGCRRAPRGCAIAARSSRAWRPT